MKYEYKFGGTITVEANSEEEAYALADELIALSSWCADNSEDCGIYELELINEYDD